MKVSPEPEGTRAAESNWAKIPQGTWVQLDHGEDFPQDSKRAAQALRQYCHYHGIPCQIKRQGPNQMVVRLGKVDDD